VTAALEQLMDELANRVADVVIERLRGPATDLVDQHGSPLGNRRHIRAVRRRMASGQSGASRVGRRYLLTLAALGEELEGRVASHRASGPERTDVRAELEAELRLIRGGDNG